ncbi:hypothetical protein NRI_0073 [Neorickettsia risticii str. Illinois]|uniref:Uncharacterized protein n=1 Tax=Neorickettsia risticii (strain Illinois) TaxID=434131 RepID=C6V3V5_NEORI|nr:hypothetical protein [Neorickettsia risticii]ACT69058.1 hypothetical protein NRI_0073 [Neorickettsia risticii str. Illinois]
MLVEKKEEKGTVSRALRRTILFFVSLLSTIIFAVCMSYRIPWRDDWDVKESWWCFVYLQGVLLLLGMVLLLRSILNALTIDTPTSKEKAPSNESSNKEPFDGCGTDKKGKKAVVKIVKSLCLTLLFVAFVALVALSDYAKLSGRFSLTIRRVLGGLECAFLAILLALLIASCFPTRQQTKDLETPTTLVPGDDGVGRYRVTTTTDEGGTLDMMAATMTAPTGEEIAMFAMNAMTPGMRDTEASAVAARLSCVMNPEVVAVDFRARIAVGTQNLVVQCMQRGLRAIASESSVRASGALPAPTCEDSAALSLSAEGLGEAPPPSEGVSQRLCELHAVDIEDIGSEEEVDFPSRG